MCRDHDLFELRRPSTRVLTLDTPATRWSHALPSGNGRLGALVFGNIFRDTIVLNHERWWYGSRTPDLPVLGAEALAAVRDLLRQGQYDKANTYYPDLLRQNHYSPAPAMYQPGVDLILKTRTSGEFAAYQRSLDLDTGEIRVQWQDQGVRFLRSLFVSRSDDLIGLRIISNQAAAVNLSLSVQPRDLYDSLLPHTTPQQSVPLVFQSSLNGNLLHLAGQRPDGSTFGALARVIASGGRLEPEDQMLHVRDADEVLVLVQLYAGDDVASAEASLCLRQHDRYAALLERHVEQHRPLMQAVNLDLGEQPVSSNEQTLLDAYRSGVVPTSLMETMFNFGRYLLISSSRPGGLPANLQGLWNGDYDPAWYSAFFNNENIQMNYWQALPGNLSQTLLPLFDLYDSLLPDFRRNAQALYGCRGIVVPVYISPDSGLLKDLQSHVVYWSAGAGWIGQIYYDYWLFTQDDDFLRRRAVPFLKEVAAFYEDFLLPGPDGQYLVMPSNSPENWPQGDFSGSGTLAISINATMDIAVAREAIRHLCEACEHLGIEADGVARWRAMLSRLPPYQLNSDGAIREWQHPDLLDNYEHRHLSHIYPLFPGSEITRQSRPELFRGCKVAVEKRRVIGLKDQTAWSLSHLCNIFARLGEGDQALNCLELQARHCLGPNYFSFINDHRRQGVTMDSDYMGRDAPFQIDANLGWTAGVMEMLVSTTPEEISLLPALPEKWQKGRITGLCGRGGTRIDLQWSPDGLQAAITLGHRSDVLIRLPRTAQSSCASGSDQPRLDRIDSQTLRLCGTPGHQYVLHVQWPHD